LTETRVADGTYSNLRYIFPKTRVKCSRVHNGRSRSSEVIDFTVSRQPVLAA